MVAPARVCNHREAKGYVRAILERVLAAAAGSFFFYVYCLYRIIASIYLVIKERK